MARQQLPPQIKIVYTGSGEKRYQLCVDTGIVDGKRKQIRRNYVYEKDAKDKLATVLNERENGTYVHKRNTTVQEAITQWLASRTSWRDSTRTGHQNRLKPLIALYGDLPIQELKKTHIETLMARLESGDIPRPKGQKRRPSKGQSRRNILSSIRQLLDHEVDQGHLPRNVAQLVDTPSLDSTERPTHTVEQLQKVLDITADDRDGHQHQLGSLGLRKQELAGLGWEYINMDDRTMSIERTRTIVDGKVVIGKPKTDRSKRALPIPDPVYDSLVHAQKVQAKERAEAGDKYCDSGYVLVDKLGRPVYPDYLTDRWKDACERAGVPVINLHDERHTCATLMILNGVPIPTVSAWLGHATAAFTMTRYVHNQPHMLLAAAESLGTMMTKPSTKSSDSASIR